MEPLSELWQELCAPYCSDQRLLHSCWREIEKAYRGKRRYYHNLVHLETLLSLAEQQRPMIQDYDTLRFSIFYHDIVYRTLRKDNELKSAQIARKRLNELGVPSSRVTYCCRQIEATAQHRIPQTCKDPDLAYFLDFDLAILGADWDQYLTYSHWIRQEYYIYPNWMYRKGRRKVLSHFLNRDKLFFTALFFEQYEFKARRNLARELEGL